MFSTTACWACRGRKGSAKRRAKSLTWMKSGARSLRIVDRLAGPAQPGADHGGEIARRNAAGFETLGKLSETFGAEGVLEFGERAEGEHEAALDAAERGGDLAAMTVRSHQIAVKTSAPADSSDISNVTSPA